VARGREYHSLGVASGKARQLSINSNDQRIEGPASKFESVCHLLGQVLVKVLVRCWSRCWSGVGQGVGQVLVKVLVDQHQPVTRSAS
jgi:hypothetical protein